MPGIDPTQYDQQGSRFGTGAASKRGTFGQYLGGGGNLGDFVGQMQGTFKPPSGTNAQEEQAYAGQTEAANFEQWGDGLNRHTQRQGQVASLGAGAVSSQQQWVQAKEMAKFNAKSAKQNAIFGAIGSGISMLGGLKSAGAFGGGGGGSSSASGNSTLSSGFSGTGSAVGGWSFPGGSSMFRRS